MIIGRTGSGKSQFGLELLASQNWDVMPWVIIDYKGEDLIHDIMKENRGAIRTVKVTDSPPKSPGLYYMNPGAMLDDEAMEAFLMKVHKQGNCGLFVDEGYALPKFGNSIGFTLILTQGRTLNIPVIILYQRPVWMSRFAVAQSDFRSVFVQGETRDEKVTENFCKPALLKDGKIVSPTGLNSLPPFYSLWHDVGRGRTDLLQPASSRKDILLQYRTRLAPQQQRRFV